ncbi:DUF2963 domain-containing protein [Candidatus Phytoplasma pini]|uniref:DUF2963 domain-containing protein n=1 Tax=Candidatus Phytoplasma pini TaxID=267362 RepID=A0A559KJ29_9MOLU|nr:hypothetical protein [Candidatus Phytoplasma pini]TVY12098.1 hypothetical protein MDPP_00363 [Candidatus Phytoplasma pini]
MRINVFAVCCSCFVFFFTLFFLVFFSYSRFSEFIKAADSFDLSKKQNRILQLQEQEQEKEKEIAKLNENIQFLNHERASNLLHQQELEQKVLHEETKNEFASKLSEEQIEALKAKEQEALAKIAVLQKEKEEIEDKNKKLALKDINNLGALQSKKIEIERLEKEKDQITKDKNDCFEEFRKKALELARLKKEKEQLEEAKEQIEKEKIQVEREKNQAEKEKLLAFNDKKIIALALEQEKKYPKEYHLNRFLHVPHLDLKFDFENLKLLNLDVVEEFYSYGFKKVSKRIESDPITKRKIKVSVYRNDDNHTLKEIEFYDLFNGDLVYDVYFEDDGKTVLSAVNTEDLKANKRGSVRYGVVSCQGAVKFMEKRALEEKALKNDVAHITLYDLDGKRKQWTCSYYRPDNETMFYRYKVLVYFKDGQSIDYVDYYDLNYKEAILRKKTFYKSDGKTVDFEDNLATLVPLTMNRTYYCDDGTVLETLPCSVASLKPRVVSQYDLNTRKVISETYYQLHDMLPWYIKNYDSQGKYLDTVLCNKDGTPSSTKYYDQNFVPPKLS